MTTSGFETYTSTGALQASSNMYSYHLRKTGTASTIARSFGNTEASDLIIPRPAGISDQALCAVQIPGYGVGFYGYGSSGFSFATSAPVGTTANWFIFDKINGVTPGNFGIETYDSAGKLTFSTNFRPMSAVAMLSSRTMSNGGWSGTSYFGDGGSVTLAGKSLACLQGAPAGRSLPGIKSCWIGGVKQPLGPPEGQTCDYYTYTNNGKIFGGTVSADKATVSTAAISWDDVTVTDPEGDDEGWEIPLKLFVIDVTNVPIGATFF